MMMSYPDVYVASISLGANYQQTINAIVEADAHPGPSIVIAYCPCINHGIRAGMGDSIVEERKAVATGYWDLYRRNPAAKPSLSIDSATPHTDQLDAFLDGEDRYADLRLVAGADVVTNLRKEMSDHISATYNLLEYNSKYGY